MKSWLTVAVFLLFLLSLSVVLMTLGRSERLAEPSADSYRPSGLAAFADLLRRRGYRVSVDSSQAPSLEPGDVLVLCFIEGEEYFSSPEKQGGLLERIDEFVRGGGRAMSMTFDEDFEAGSKGVTDLPAVSSFHPEKRTVACRPPGRYSASNADPIQGDVSVPLWHQAGQALAAITTLSSSGQGLMLGVADGYMATNRFIDRGENADVLLSSLATIAPKGSRLVFLEEVFRSQDQAPTVIGILGPGASAAWYQAWLVFAVIIFTLGKRFGLPDESRPTQLGQRELVDAIADVYLRSGQTQAVCQAAYERADAKVRRVLKLPEHAPPAERDARVAAELASAFQSVFEGTVDKLSNKEAFARCRRLSKELEGFVATKTALGARPPKR